MGGGGAALTAPVAESDASAKIGIMPPFEAVAYKYIYGGEEIKQAAHDIWQALEREKARREALMLRQERKHGKRL